MRRSDINATDGLRFDIIRPLGVGGSGTVYEARDRRSDELVALKQLTRNGPHFLLRFKKEFRALADIHHPNLVELRELVEQHGRWFIIMELLDGEDLLGFLGPWASGQDARVQRLARLRRAFIDMARGLEALHAHGMLHRDLKPSNVRMHRDGRAVLLDFGLVTSANPESQSTHAHGVGTALYMAPEQVFSDKLGAAADWYAFGACLYEALTGRLPIDGRSAVEIAVRKQQQTPVEPLALAPWIDPELSQLCMQLLRVAPHERPSGKAVLRMLGADSEPVRIFTVPAPPTPFAGRSAELARLEQALSRTRQGALQLVLIRGESGVGKTELVEEFVRRQTQANPLLIALSSRCYENERMAYKAFDGSVDQMARSLLQAEGDSERLLPPRAGLLAQLFPVLGGIRAITASGPYAYSADPTARRLQAFGAFVLLLRNIAARRPLVLIIDDLQWADGESFRLLRAIAEAPRPPPILIVATVRLDAELDADVRDAVAVVRRWPCTQPIDLDGLALDQAEALARSLLNADADPAWARTIAIESGGHPLLLSELLRYTAGRRLERDAITLEAALATRVNALEPQERALLELAALAGRPYPSRVFADALGLTNVDPLAKTLLSAKLLRRRRDQELTCHHDDLRLVVLKRIAAPERARLHRKLAGALAGSADADATDQARHWDLAGEPEKAASAYEKAASEAFAALAFDQAEGLYQRAIELTGQGQRDSYARLLVARAQALSCAGRSAEAATLYEHSAALHSGEPRLRLRSAAARQLLLSMQAEAGLSAARAILKEVGITLPTSTVFGLVRFFWSRFCLRVRPPRFDERAAPPRSQVALDLMLDLLGALSCVHTPAYMNLACDYVRRAARAAPRDHLPAAASYEGWLRTLGGSLKSGQAYFALSRSLLSRVHRPAAVAYQADLEGSARLAGWDWAGAATCFERALHIAEAHCREDPWQLTSIRYHLGLAWYYLGQHRSLQQESERWLAEAYERNDAYGIALLTGMGHASVRHLMRNRTDQALRELSAAIAPFPPRPFGFAQLGHLIGTQRALLARGGTHALRWFQQHERALSRAILLKSRTGREIVLILQGFAWLSACEDAAAAGRAPLLKAARRIVGSLRSQNPFTRGHASLLRSQISFLTGQPEIALAQARSAQALFAPLGVAAAHVAQYLEGALEGGEAGKEKRAASLAFYRSQGWRDPRLGVRLTLPTLSLLR